MGTKDDGGSGGKKVLVTGASGYLGGKLCQALIAEGYIVRALVRRSSVLSSLPPPSASFEIVHGDVTELHSLIGACAGCHFIFHTAALVEPWIPDPSRFISVNVVGLKNVLQACRETDTLQKILYTSSFFALGPTDGYVADETQVHPGKLFCSEYEKSKAIADSIALQASRDGQPIVLLYPGVIYGSGKMTSGNVVARIIIERFNGRLPGYMGNGGDAFSFCHIDDVVHGHITAMHKGRVGERYLLTGENASFKQIFDTAALITGTKKPSFHIPLWVIEIYGWVSVFFARITGRIPLISYPTVWVMKHQWSYSCEKARKELHYNPRSLSEGLAEILPWLKNLGLVKY